MEGTCIPHRYAANIELQTDLVGGEVRFLGFGKNYGSLLALGPGHPLTTQNGVFQLLDTGVFYLNRSSSVSDWKEIGTGPVGDTVASTDDLDPNAVEVLWRL